MRVWKSEVIVVGMLGRDVDWAQADNFFLQVRDIDFLRLTFLSLQANHICTIDGIARVNWPLLQLIKLSIYLSYL